MEGSAAQEAYCRPSYALQSGGISHERKANPASAVPIFWRDWFGTFSSGQARGTITTPTSTVNVTYTNTNGIAFFQTGAPGETDYWTSGGVRNPATSPYTNAVVDNIPTGTDIVA